MKPEDFLTIEKKDGIATIWIDHKLEKMNIVSPEVIEILGGMFDDLESDPEIKAGVIISRKPDFMAGADIKAFAIEKEGDFRPTQAHGHASLERLEKSKKPVVAAINGTCVGLGVELMLACHARVASNSPKTKFALPEVMLGLLPGGGGTQRLPKLISLQKALDMMLTGRNIYAYQAKKMGLVDVLTDEHKLHSVAVQVAKKIIKEPIKRKKPLSFVDKLLEKNPIGRNVIFKQVKKMSYKQAQGNYPAIPAIIECVETGVKQGNKAGYEKELEHFEKLMLTPESAALRSLFFGMTDNKKNPYSENPRKLNTLGMIGAGFMGAGIAEISIPKGITVLLKDIKDEVIIEAEKQIWKGLSKKVRRKSLSKTQAEAVMANLQPQLDYDGFEHADIVIEAVVEKMDLKKMIIDQVQEECSPEVIFATNTSSLSVTEMANHAKKPENVIGMHYFSPVPKMPLLEIVKTDFTSEEVIAACYDFGIRQGKTCVVVKDGPGFYVNRILAPYLNECLLMIDEGIALEKVDKALIKKGFPVGPITLLDEVGLDIAAHSTESTKQAVENREGVKISLGVIKMFKAGRLGKKNKQGFYKYHPKKGKRTGPDPTVYQFFEGDGKKDLPREEIQNRALMLMLNEAIWCLDEGIIANPKDGDLGAVFGIGFLPFTGGPFRAIDQWGVANVVKIMADLEAKYGARFKAHPMLKKMAETNARFHES